jgi:hypothetical protein
LDARLTILFCNIRVYILAKSKKAKTGSDLAEPPNEGCGSKRAVLPVMMMMVVVVVVVIVYQRVYSVFWLGERS